MTNPEHKENGTLVYPDDPIQFKEEVEKVLRYMATVDSENVRCLALCIIERAPTDSDPTRVKASHMVLGSQSQMAAMLASTYSAISRTFDGEREAKETPKEKYQ